MKLNERGGTLVTVLLVILVFSVLGFALMGSVVGENKRTHTTESNMKARYQAESGLTYFVTDFNKFIKEETNLNSMSIETFKSHLISNFLANYMNENGLTVGDVWTESKPKEINIKAEIIGNNTLKVTSRGKDRKSEETLIGNYKIKYTMDIDGPTYELAEFNADGRFVDFSQSNLLGLDLLRLIGLNLINPVGPDSTFYPVPKDNLIGADLVFGLVAVSIPGRPFSTMEDNHVVATRDGVVLAADLLNLAIIDVLRYKDKNDTNVLINGSHETGIKINLPLLNLLGLSEMNYSDINFKKLAVLGNTIIQQDHVGGKYWTLLSLLNWRNIYTYDSEPKRTFTFSEGLFVNKSLIIGGNQNSVHNKEDYHGVSNLKLNGNMVAMKDLYINYVNLEIGNSSGTETIYVHRNAKINNACINKDNLTNKFRLLAKGSITLENNGGCSTYNGLFYAENGIYIITHGTKVTINGGLIGDVFVYDGVPPDNKSLEELDYVTLEEYGTGNNVEYNPDPAYNQNLKFKSITLEPQGRTFQE